MNGYRYRLGVVAAGTSADSKKQIYVVFSCNLHALVEFLHRRIRHDTAVLYDGLAAVFQHLYDLIVDAVFLNGSAAVDQLHGWSVFLKLSRKLLQGVLSKVEFCWIAVRE